MDREHIAKQRIKETDSSSKTINFSSEIKFLPKQREWEKAIDPVLSYE